MVYELERVLRVCNGFLCSMPVTYDGAVLVTCDGAVLVTYDGAVLVTYDGAVLIASDFVKYFFFV